jgi:hypothetical protein
MLAAVIIMCLVAAAASLAFSFVALFRDTAEVEKTASAINESAVAAAKAGENAREHGQGLAAQTEAQAALSSGLTDYVKALAELATSLSRLRQGAAGLFMAFALLGLAGGLAAIDDKVADKAPAVKSRTVGD